MIATCVIEMGLAVFVALRYPSTLFRTIVLTLLVCLASFQLAEYEICVGPMADGLAWTKLGLVGITIRPALGMHVIGTVTRRSFIIPVSYTVAILYGLTFPPGATGPAECMGNYVILHIHPGIISIIYDAYYMFFVALAIVELTLRLTARGRPNEHGYSRNLIILTLFAYLSFTLPMGIVAIVDASLRRAAPSIMCGFAVAMALIVSLLIVPQYAKETAGTSATPLEPVAA